MLKILITIHHNLYFAIYFIVLGVSTLPKDGPVSPFISSFIISSVFSWALVPNWTVEKCVKKSKNKVQWWISFVLLLKWIDFSVNYLRLLETVVDSTLQGRNSFVTTSLDRDAWQTATERSDCYSVHREPNFDFI